MNKIYFFNVFEFHFVFDIPNIQWYLGPKYEAKCCPKECVHLDTYKISFSCPLLS